MFQVSFSPLVGLNWFSFLIFWTIKVKWGWFTKGGGTLSLSCIKKGRSLSTNLLRDNCVLIFSGFRFFWNCWRKYLGCNITILLLGDFYLRFCFSLFLDNCLSLFHFLKFCGNCWFIFFSFRNPINSCFVRIFNKHVFLITLWKDIS